MSKNSKKDVQLGEAREFCLEKGLNFTPMRQWVYREIAMHGSLGAYEIADHLSSGGLQINAVSVYRALEFLMEAGLVYKINSHKKYAISPLNDIDASNTISVVLVCTQTGAAMKYSSAALAECISRMATEIGFKISRAVVEVEGDGRSMMPQLPETREVKLQSKGSKLDRFPI
ncbi:Fur family transcriptional regulator [Microvirga sp. 2MCAF38]|uniref:Fur family transcriptional regulator n=1 Tax=Microvirga sp. 2MCAF38 TaxID=3232989 RepID=UPI003F9CE38F